MITWIASYPKSGNTWMRLLLSGYYSDIVDINNISRSILDYQPFFYNNLLLDSKKPSDVMHVRTTALYHMSRFFTDPLYLKTHWGNYELVGIKAIPPQLTKAAIVVVRDPRDLVVSLANFYQQSYDDIIDKMNNELAGTYEDYSFYLLKDWNSYIKSWMDTSFPVIFVKYEDLLEDSVNIFTNVLKLLELPEKNMVEIAKSAQFHKIQQQEKDHGFNEAKNGATFFNNGRSVYQECLTKEQIKKVEDHNKEMMTFLGYLKADEDN